MQARSRTQVSVFFVPLPRYAKVTLLLLYSLLVHCVIAVLTIAETMSLLGFLFCTFLHCMLVACLFIPWAP
jgi:hypothetical protein